MKDINNNKLAELDFHFSLLWYSFFFVFLGGGGGNLIIITNGEENWTVVLLIRKTILQIKQWGSRVL